VATDDVLAGNRDSTQCDLAGFTTATQPERDREYFGRYDRAFFPPLSRPIVHDPTALKPLADTPRQVQPQQPRPRNSPTYVP